MKPKLHKEVQSMIDKAITGRDNPVPKEKHYKTVTVITLDKDGNQGEYSFQIDKGQTPDFTRIARETIGEGMMAAIVKGWDRFLKQQVSGTSYIIANPCLNASNISYHCATRMIDASIESLRAAIKEYKEADWEVEVAGVKVRACFVQERVLKIEYWDNEIGNWGYSSCYHPMSSDINFGLHICAQNNIPIKPFGWKEES